MARDKEIKEAGLTVRFTPTERALVAEAAAVDRRTDSDYIRLAAIRAAETDLAESAA